VVTYNPSYDVIVAAAIEWVQARDACMVPLRTVLPEEYDRLAKAEARLATAARAAIV
jgi:hypothetical protein